MAQSCRHVLTNVAFGLLPAAHSRREQQYLLAALRQDDSRGMNDPMCLWAAPCPPNAHKMLQMDAIWIFWEKEKQLISIIFLWLEEQPMPLPVRRWVESKL